MIEEEMKVGPKGQVVIPRALRKALKIGPGAKVVLRLEGDKVVLAKPDIDAVGIFEGLAKKGRSVKVVEPHLYEQELAARA